MDVEYRYIALADHLPTVVALEDQPLFVYSTDGGPAGEVCSPQGGVPGGRVRAQPCVPQRKRPALWRKAFAWVERGPTLRHPVQLALPCASR
jgi:hypothetical protein